MIFQMKIKSFMNQSDHSEAAGFVNNQIMLYIHVLTLFKPILQ